VRGYVVRDPRWGCKFDNCHSTAKAAKAKTSKIGKAKRKSGKSENITMDCCAKGGEIAFTSGCTQIH